MFQRLDKLMPQSVRRAGAERTVRAAMILDAAHQEISGRFGHEAAAAMRPVKFKDGIVTVKCAESAMTDEIRMHESEIVDGANARLGEIVVRKIRAIG